jgi:hypothetical protein
LDRDGDAAEERVIAGRYCPAELRGDWAEPDKRVVPMGTLAHLQLKDAPGVLRDAPIPGVSSSEILSAQPIRRLKSRRRAPGRVGWVWSGTLVPRTDRKAAAEHLIGAESFNFEARYLLAAEFDPAIVAVVSQPFRLRCPGRPAHGHVPDYFVVRADGAGGVVDVRPSEQLDEQTRAIFSDTAAVVAAAGWGHCVWSELSTTLAENLSWFSRVRDASDVHQPTVELAVQLLDGDCYLTLEEKLLAAGAPPLLIRPAIDHAVWHGRIRLDMTAPVDVGTLLYAAAPRTAAPLVLREQAGPAQDGVIAAAPSAITRMEQPW